MLFFTEGFIRAFIIKMYTVNLHWGKDNERAFPKFNLPMNPFFQGEVYGIGLTEQPEIAFP